MIFFYCLDNGPDNNNIPVAGPSNGENVNGMESNSSISTLLSFETIPIEFSEIVAETLRQSSTTDEREITERVSRMEARLNNYERRGYTNQPDDELKRRADEWLAQRLMNRAFWINPDIIGYAMASHPYMWMTRQDRRRLNKLRYEIDRFQETMEQNPQEPNHLDAVCPICFDGIQLGKEFWLLLCGHVLCEECISGIRNHQPEPKCGVCNAELETIRRIYFSFRN